MNCYYCKAELKFSIGGTAAGRFVICIYCGGTSIFDTEEFMYPIPVDLLLEQHPELENVIRSIRVRVARKN